MFKRRRLILFFVLGITAVFLAVDPLSKIYVPPILMYHSVTPAAKKGDRLAVSVAAFERQMRFLKEFRYNVVSLEEMSGMIRGGRKIPRGTVAITFDDGFEDNYIYALPVLKRYNLPAAVFVIVNEIGWPGRLNWDEMKMMSGSGLIVFGDHTFSHPRLTALNEEGLKKEIIESKRIMEEKLKQPVRMFCYPFNDYNDGIKRIVKDAGFELAVAVFPKNGSVARDPYAMGRVPVLFISDNLLLFWVQNSGYFGFLQDLIRLRGIPRL